jgi:hypothetical protein
VSVHASHASEWATWRRCGLAPLSRDARRRRPARWPSRLPSRAISGRGRPASPSELRRSWGRANSPLSKPSSLSSEPCRCAARESILRGEQRTERAGVIDGPLDRRPTGTPLAEILRKEQPPATSTPPTGVTHKPRDRLGGQLRSEYLTVDDASFPASSRIGSFGECGPVVQRLWERCGQRTTCRGITLRTHPRQAEAVKRRSG